MTVPPGNQPPYPPQGQPPQPPQGQPPYQPPAPQPPAPQPPQQPYPAAPQPPVPPAGYGAPPAFQPPPPPMYPTTPPAPAHKLSGALIAGIVAAIVLIAGGVTAAFVLTGKSSATTSHSGNSLGNGNLGNGNNTSPAPTPTQPAPTPTQPAPTPTAPAPTPTQPAPTPGNGGGGGVDLGNGVSLTPAAGWKIVRQTASSVSLMSPDQSCEFDIYTGKAGSSDANAELTALANEWAKDNSAQDVKVSSPDGPKAVNGQNFQQLSQMQFQATLAGQQGTLQLFGNFLVLLNTSSGNEAQLVLASTNQSLPSNIVDAVNGMLNSLI